MECYRLRIRNSFSILLLVLTIIIQIKCDIPFITVKREITNEGFHRNLKTLFRIDSLPTFFHNCVWAVEERMPTGVYVDPDQLEDIERSNVSSHKMMVIGDVSVETSEHNSTPHKLMIFINGNDIPNLKNIVTTFPFHLRYHKAVSGGLYTDIKVNPPLLLSKCNENPMVTEKIEAPCLHNDSKLCTWNVIPFNVIKEDTFIQIPVGNLDHSYLVLVFTSVVVVIGCIAIISPLLNKNCFI